MLTVEPSVYFLVALLVLSLPFDWIMSAVCAAGFHEMCHLLAVRLSGGSIHSVKIGIGGAVMDVDLDRPLQEFFCAVAGPAGSFILLFLIQRFPKTALCAGIQGLYNLLPVYPLDGGRMLRLFLERISPKQAQRAEKIIGIVVLAGIEFSAAAVSGMFSLGILPHIVTLILAIKVFRRKIPCKEGENRVQ